MIDAGYWGAKLLIEMKSVAWEMRRGWIRWSGSVLWAEPHICEARNSQTYIRNDPHDDLNESNDATDPVDDDSVTNYTHQIIISRDKKLENNRREWIPPVYQEIYVSVLESRESVLGCQIIYYPRVSTNISLARLSPALRTLYNSVFWQVSAPRVFTNLKYLDKSRMSLADCGPVCLCSDARLRSHTIVFLYWLTICFSCSPFVMAASHKNPSDIVTQPRPVTLLRLISVTHTHKHLANCHTTKSKTPDILFHA